MAKKLLIGTVAVFITWEILDFVIHNLILMDSYAATAHLWRPEGEMKMGLMVMMTAGIEIRTANAIWRRQRVF